MLPIRVGNHPPKQILDAVHVDLLLACYLANATCAIINIMATLIFVILIISQLHAFFLVVAVRSFLHVLVAAEGER